MKAQLRILWAASSSMGGCWPCLVAVALYFQWVASGMAANPSAGLQVVTSLAHPIFHSTDQAFDPLPVRVEAQVLVFDREWGQFYLHDGKDTAYLLPESTDIELKPGQRVRLTGTAVKQGSNVRIQDGRAEVIGSKRLPDATVIKLAQAQETSGSWVVTTGRVRTADDSHGRWRIVVDDGGRTCSVLLADAREKKDFSGLADATVTVRGINNTPRDGSGPPAITAGAWNEIRVINRPAQSLKSLTVLSVESLLNRELGAWTNQPVRLSGSVHAYRPGKDLVIEDPTGSMRARVAQETALKRSERIDLWGFLCITPDEVLLSNAWFEVSRTDNPGLDTPATSDPLKPVEGASVLLTRVVDVHGLPNERAALELPVRLRGVLTYVDQDWHAAFLQDDTDAVYMSLGEDSPKLRYGDLLEVTGTTIAGAFAPCVQVRAISVLGRTNLPPPAKLELSDVAEGQFDAQMVKLEGVVRRVQQEFNHLHLVLTSAKGPFKAVLPHFSAPAPTNLIDVPVALSGACGSDLNSRGQVSGITLHVPCTNRIRLLEPIPTDPFLAETTLVAKLSTFAPARRTGRRVKILGTVTAVLPNGDFYLQDGSGGIAVRLNGEQHVRVGDRVEVLGFPAIGDFSPLLEEACARVVGSGEALRPVDTTADQIIVGATNDSMLVTVEGNLVQYSRHSVRPKLTLQNGAIIFSTHLMRRYPDGSAPELREGSHLRLQGICEIKSGGSLAPEAFRILVFDPARIEVLSAPGWWTSRHTLFLLGGLTVITLLALGWVGILRKQVLTQTLVIRKQLKEKQVFAESLAYERDLLDTLMNNLPDAIFFKDLNSRFVRVSKSKAKSLYDAAVQLHSSAHNGNGKEHLPLHLTSLERFSEFLPGKSDTDFLDENHARESFQDEQQIMRTGKPLIGKLQYQSGADGSGSWYLVTKMPWRDPQGKIIGTFGLNKDITSIKEAEARVESIHRELLLSSRQAGMAEVATSVLHNVGNVLNSVNVSASLVSSKVRNSKIPKLGLAARLMREHSADLGAFMTTDPKGTRLPEYLEQLAEHLAEEQTSIMAELDLLTSNIEHIKDIVTMQQNYAKVAGVAETVNPADLVEDALRMNVGALARHEVLVVREFQAQLPEITVEKHKVLQVLVNLIRNAKYACDESGRHEKRMTLRITSSAGKVQIAVADNGVGIARENMTRIFNHGFTTRAHGHGFGLHSGALAARELGGALRAHSDGPGKGATFTLELPVSPAAASSTAAPSPAQEIGSQQFQPA